LPPATDQVFASVEEVCEAYFPVDIGDVVITAARVEHVTVPTGKTVADEALTELRRNFERERQNPGKR
jgi:hypothetical protein